MLSHFQYATFSFVETGISFTRNPCTTLKPPLKYQTATENTTLYIVTSSSDRQKVRQKLGKYRSR